MSVGHRPPIGKAWHLRADFDDAIRIEIDKPHPGRLAPHIEQDLAPGIDDQTVPVCPPSILVQPDLRGRDHERARKNHPVGLRSPLPRSFPSSFDQVAWDADVQEAIDNKVTSADAHLVRPRCIGPDLA